METLKNLKQLASLAAGRFNQYEGKDFVLPSYFKEKVKEINNSEIFYNQYSAMLQTKGNQHGILGIFLPNQWFYIASYFTELYNELLRYKRYALKVTTKDRLNTLKGSKLSEEEKQTLSSLDIDSASKGYLEKFITNYEWWGGAKTIDRNDFYVSPILSHARLVNASQSYVAELCAFLADKADLVKCILGAEEASENTPVETNSSTLQQIYYGAPGTGKSYTINAVTAEAGDNVIRTTFHPDSDYSTFVGAYKPTKKSVKVRDMAGHVVTDVNEETGKTEVVTEDRIVYRFVAQAFIQAYTRAWRNLAATAEGEQPKPVYLVIEEINRGNCAQIFGDLFQLLDRNDYGFSDYPIIADSDMSTYLYGAMRSVRDRISGDAKLTIDSMYKHGVVDDVINGNVLLLPSNLYIWATMNTSDQSLFPIDSAFKRRWDWTYMPISDAGKHYTIRVDGARYDWWQFLEKINAKIGETTNSEDKKLGYFFCKADAQGEISAEKFVGKVIFYLWNDVFKDYEFSDAIFNDEDGEKLTFDKFHRAVGQKAEIVESKVQLFLKNLGLEPISSEGSTEEETTEDENIGAESTKLPRTAREFSVTFPDGVTVEESHKFDTYYNTLLKIGLDKVEPIAAEKKYQRRNSPLVSKEKSEELLSDPTYRYIQNGEYYVVKGMNDITLYNMIKYLSDRLNLGLTVIYR